MWALVHISRLSSMPAICMSEYSNYYIMQMTSVFLHAFPALVAWAGRWHSGDPHHWKGPQDSACQSEHATATVRELILVPWVPYALWAVAYYLKIFVVSSQKIQDRGYHTLFKYTTRKPKSLAGKLIKKLPRWAAPLFFMGNHVIFCAVTFTWTWLMWSHYWLNTAFLVWCLGMSAWNGGNYYFEVFAHKYVNEVGISKPSKTGAAATEPVEPRSQSVDGTRSGDGGEEDAAEVIKGVGRSRSDGALTSTHLVEEMEYLEEQMIRYEEQRMHEVGTLADGASMSSLPDSVEADPGVFASPQKVDSHPVVSSSELPETPAAAVADSLDERSLRRRAVEASG